MGHYDDQYDAFYEERERKYREWLKARIKKGDYNSLIEASEHSGGLVIIRAELFRKILDVIKKEP